MPSFHLFLGSDDGVGELFLAQLEILQFGFSEQHRCDALDPLSSHLAHDQVIECDEEDGNSRVSLPSGTSSELIVYSPRFMFLRTEDEESVVEILFHGILGLAVRRLAEDLGECIDILSLASIELDLHHDVVMADPVILCIPDQIIAHSQRASDGIHGQFEFDGRIDIHGNSSLIVDLFLDPLSVIIRDLFVQSLLELDIRSPTGHVGRDDDALEFPCLGDDMRFLFMEFRVQDIMRDRIFFEDAGDIF